MTGDGAEMMILRGAGVEIACFPSETTEGGTTTTDSQCLSYNDQRSAMTRKQEQRNDLTSRVTRSASSTAASTPSTHSLVAATSSVSTDTSPTIVVLHSIEPADFPDRSNNLSFLQK